MGTVDEATKLMMDFQLWESLQTLFSGMVGSWWVFPIYITLVFTVAMVTRSLEVVASFVAISTSIMIYYDILPVFYEYISYIIVVICVAVLLFQFFGTSER